MMKEARAWIQAIVSTRYFPLFILIATGLVVGVYTVTDYGESHDEMLRYRCWTIGHNVWRLKETTNLLPDGTYQIPTTEEIFNDYRYSTGDQIQKPQLPSSETASV